MRYHILLLMSHKIKIFKKLTKICFLFSEIGNYSQITNNVIEDTKKFIITALYNRNKKESYAISELNYTKVLNESLQ